MIRRNAASILLSAAIVAAIVTGASHAQPDSAKATPRTVDSRPSGSSVRTGNLFSAVTFADSALGVAWSRLRAEAVARFPGLRLTKVEDLHVTVVYIGGDWKAEDLDRIRARALVVPTASVRLTPEVVQLGHNSQVVAVELHGNSSVWADSVVTAKGALNRLGLKKPESYDTNFRSHITLAQASHSPPTPADSAGLAGFQSWMDAKLAEDPRRFTVTVGPTTRVLLLLAGTARPDGAPEYVTVEDFLEQQAALPAGK
jgi:hypothetical protein